MSLSQQIFSKIFHQMMTEIEKNYTQSKQFKPIGPNISK